MPIAFPTLLKMLLRDESGAAMLEYALIVALVSVFTIAGLTALGQNINALFLQIAQILG